MVGRKAGGVALFLRPEVLLWAYGCFLRSASKRPDKRPKHAVAHGWPPDTLNTAEAVSCRLVEPMNGCRNMAVISQIQSSLCNQFRYIQVQVGLDSTAY